MPMLELINRYSYGYVAIPVILASEERGFFKLFKEYGPQTLDQLSKRLDVENGYFESALRMLKSLQWISWRTGAYPLDPRSESHEKIPTGIIDLFHFPKDKFISQPKQRRSLQNWIDLSHKCWEVSDLLMTDFLDGVLVLPLMTALNQHDLQEDLDEMKGAHIVGFMFTHFDQEETSPRNSDIFIQVS